MASGKNIKFITIRNYREMFDKKKKDKIRNALDESELCFIKLPTNIGIMMYHEVIKRKKKCIVEVVGCVWGTLWNYGTIKAKVIAPILYVLNRYYIRKSKNVIYVSNQFLQKKYPTLGNSISCSDVRLPIIEEEILQKRIEKIENIKDDYIYRLGLIGALDLNYKGHEIAIKALERVKEKVNFE